MESSSLPLKGVHFHQVHAPEPYASRQAADQPGHVAEAQSARLGEAGAGCGGGVECVDVQREIGISRW